ncbi:hypothetical protein [Actinoplanes sp. NPDC051411]|uniref:hypothetical protein n=1 Tax=Actinoplanes sp. NPDC051411 TaxID=3155522 RepID=UPI0034168E5B
MATIFNRGFLLRTLPALLALVLGLLVAPQQPAPHAAALPQATAYRTVAAPAAVHSGHSADPSAEPEAPSTPGADPIEQRPRALHAQITVGADGSRAPPSPLV